MEQPEAIQGMQDMEGSVETIMEKLFKSFFGSLGIDTNNSAELEGMIQGIQIIIGNGWLPAIVEGDSRILIQMA